MSSSISVASAGGNDEPRSTLSNGGVESTDIMMICRVDADVTAQTSFPCGIASIASEKKLLILFRHLKREVCDELDLFCNIDLWRQCGNLVSTLARLFRYQSPISTTSFVCEPPRRVMNVSAWLLREQKSNNSSSNREARYRCRSYRNNDPLLLRDG